MGNFNRVALTLATALVAVGRPAAQPQADTLAALRGMYDRGEYEGVAAGVRQSRDLRRLVREAAERLARSQEGVDPLEAPPRVSRRELLFGLEFTAAAIFAANGDAREDAERLLGRFQSWMATGLVVDEFECTWHLAAVSVFEARGSLTAARTALDRGRDRCAGHARLMLAHARLLDRAWTFGPGSSSVPAMWIRTAPGATAIPVARPDPRVRTPAAAYEAAIANPETHAEGRIRLGWLLLRAGDVDGARVQLDGVDPGPVDRDMRYLAQLFRAQVLAAQDAWDDADAAVRRALEEVPDAQSAHVTLMTVQLARGELEAAVSRAAAVESAAERPDPYRSYLGGDIRLYAQMIGRLRESAR